jgi:predicted MPP superfamily phosphohydrolase
LLHFALSLFILLALLGDARIFLFIMNRFVFGDHTEEKNPWQFLMFVVPPILVMLTALFWPLSNWVDWLMSTHVVERITPERLEEIAWSLALAKIGAAWLIVAAVVGAYWLADRVRVNAFGEPPLVGIRTLPSIDVRLRRAHVPFAALRRLGAHNDVYDLEVTRHEILIDDLPPSFDGYRIAFLTDTHVAGFVRPDYHAAIVAQTAAFDPDAIFLGGDFVTWNRDIPHFAERVLSKLRAREGIFAVLGNHDIWAGPTEIAALLREHGVELLTNRSVILARGGDRLPLVGIDEVYRGTPDVRAAFAGIAPEGPCLAISHHPDITDLLGSHRIDLLVCGHTHGGQIRLPFFGPIVVPSKHEGSFAAGFHRLGPVLLYVSRGLGAIPPLRILCRPELATFTLRRGQRHA